MACVCGKSQGFVFSEGMRTQSEQADLCCTGRFLFAWGARVSMLQASVLYRQHNNDAALCLYTEALKLQQRLLGKQQQLDEASGEVSASNLSLLENTAKLAFNKARTKQTQGEVDWRYEDFSAPFAYSTSYLKHKESAR